MRTRPDANAENKIISRMYLCSKQYTNDPIEMESYHCCLLLFRIYSEGYENTNESCSMKNFFYINFNHTNNWFSALENCIDIIYVGQTILSMITAAQLLNCCYYIYLRFITVRLKDK